MRPLLCLLALLTAPAFADDAAQFRKALAAYQAVHQQLDDLAAQLEQEHLAAWLHFVATADLSPVPYHEDQTTSPAERQAQQRIRGLNTTMANVARGRDSGRPPGQSVPMFPWIDYDRARPGNSVVALMLAYDQASVPPPKHQVPFHAVAQP